MNPSPVHAKKDTVDAILMASGFSARFGTQNKLLAPCRGRPLALHTLALVCGLSLFRRIFLVYAQEDVGRLADGLPVCKIHNPNPAFGGGESARLGVRAASADYYMFFTCDQPLLDEGTVRAVWQSRAAGKITAPCFCGRPGNPTLFSAAFREELLALAPGQAPREIRRRHGDSAVWVPLDSALPLADVDTPEDLDALP